ncbi:MAG: AAA family ATPase [Magnetococcus sp. DMHC-6]
MADRLKLRELSLAGFKSISGRVELEQKIEFGDITVLLGANGSGKSNLFSFFNMLNFISSKGLQIFVAKNGWANTLFYYGSQSTEQIDFSITFEQGEGTEQRSSKYIAKLFTDTQSGLFFAYEKVIYQKYGLPQPYEHFVDRGNKESGLPDDEDETAKIIFGAISDIRAYQFHNTSDRAKIKDLGYIEDNRYLRSDAGNLAAFLRVIKFSSEFKKYYERIIRHIQQVMPQFKDFELEPTVENDKYIRLNWFDTVNDYLFGPHQISDGSLRFMALATLLLQPPKYMPRVIVLDEPELGLHPAAIGQLSGMIRTASKHCQVIIATQSTRLVDEFEPSHLVIVERDTTNNCSIFKRLKESQLQEWLARYSLSELWEKNVFGGRP